ncbi:MAG: glycine cleavage system aminomethyltransferase GcvT [Thiotrichaceae bacterium]|nr:glycine cleavage system aminomethyltransferase GcvT [Thiotrichaceae bacterium]
MTKPTNTPKHTALYHNHLSANATMVDFAGWEMPIHYGSQLDEHHQVRNDVGMFDISHMVTLDMRGVEVRSFLRHLLANDVNKLKETGKALYSCMLNEKGGIIDDLIVYYLDDQFYRMVINAATRDNDLQWIMQQVEAFDVQINEREDLSMIAVQGPNAAKTMATLLHGEAGNVITALKPFYAYPLGNDTFFARTGYTGEDGFEILLPNVQASDLWNDLLDVGVKPIGLGARDTLRLEAGMNLYGTDMDTSTSPLVSGLTWTVDFKDADRHFIGRNALEAEKVAGITQRFVGLVLQDKGILRNHQKIITNKGEGEITSGSFSPTLKKSIALARVPSDIGTQCKVLIRNKMLTADVVKPVFVRNGKSCLENK